MKKLTLVAAALTLSAAAAGGVAFAAGAGHNDAVDDLAKAQITLTQAVAAAEQHAGGKAARAELENERHGLIYRVEVAAAGGVMDVHVDAVNGKVLRSDPDRRDHGRDEADDD